MRQFRVPDLGIGNKEAKIVAWHVAEGDHIVADGPLVSLETEKVAVEISSPWSGHIARLLANAGDQVQVGAPLVEFTDGSEEVAAASRLAVTARKVSRSVTSPPSLDARQFLLPDLGIGDKEAAIVAWHVAEGDHVAADEQLLSVETDKATVEIPSPWSGHITRLLASVGEQVKVGSPLAVLTMGAADGEQQRQAAVAKTLEPKRKSPTALAIQREPLLQAVPVQTPAPENDAKGASAPDGIFDRANAEQLAARVPAVKEPAPEIDTQGGSSLERLMARTDAARLAKRAAAVQAPAPEMATQGDSSPEGIIARAAAERVAKRAPAVQAPAREIDAKGDGWPRREPAADVTLLPAKKRPSGGSRLLFAVELVVIFLCGLFLVWWIATMG